MRVIFAIRQLQYLAHTCFHAISKYISNNCFMIGIHRLLYLALRSPYLHFLPSCYFSSCFFSYFFFYPMHFLFLYPFIPVFQNLFSIIVSLLLFLHDCHALFYQQFWCVQFEKCNSVVRASNGRWLIGMLSRRLKAEDKDRFWLKQLAVTRY